MSQSHCLPIDHAGALLLAQLPSAPPIGAGDTTTATSQDGAPLGPGGAAPAQPQSPLGGQFIFILFGLMLFMILMSVFSGRKEKKRRAEMLASVKRHDRVMLTGGMIGTIAEIRDDEVVVKVDESNNTRIHFARSAVQSVLKSASGSASVTTDEPARELVDA